MAASCQPCGEGQSLCHLRRISSRTSVPSTADFVHFHHTVMLIGRNKRVVNCFFSSAATREGDYISRVHARVIRNAGKYVLVDCSLTGVYVNDVRIHDRVDLQEGDTVTFGHPHVRKITPGDRVRQPNSPFYFLFERCHCSSGHMQCLCAERKILLQECPTLAPAGLSPPAKMSSGLVSNTSLPWAAHMSPSCAADAHCGTSCPAITALPPPRSTPAVVPSIPTNSFNLTSGSPQVASPIGLAASTFSSLEDVHRPASRLLRSTSPDYTVLGEGPLISPDSSLQRTLEITCNISPQESPDSDNSELLSDSGQSAAELKPNSDKLTWDENSESALGPCCLGATVPALTPPPLLSPPCSGSGASDNGNFQSGRAVNPDMGIQQAPHFFQEEDRDRMDSRLSASNPEELVTGSSDHDEEIMEGDICQSTEETADCGHQVQKQKMVTMQIREEQQEAVCATKRRSAERTEEDSVEEEEKRSMEIASCGASLVETDGTANMANSLSVSWHTSLSVNSGDDWLDPANRTLDFSLGKEPEKDSPTELDPEGVRAASLPRSLSGGIQSVGHDNDEMDSEESASDGECAVEMGTQTNASLFTPHRGHLGTGGAACLEPEVSSVDPAAVGVSFVEASCADVRTQTGCVEEAEIGVATAELAEEGDTSRIPAVLGCDGSKTGTAASDASPLGFPADEYPRGESFREGERAQENVTSEDLLEALKEEGGLVATPSPAVSVVLKELVPEEPLEVLIPEKTVDAKFSDECLLQSSETPSNREEEDTGVAERKWEKASPRPANAENVLQNCIAEPMQEGEKEAHGNECPFLGMGGALVGGLPRREEPCSDSGSERKCQEEPDSDGDGGSAVKKGRSRTMAASGKDGDSPQQTAAENGLDRVQERAGSALLEGSLGSGLEEDAPWPSEDSAGRKAREERGILEVPLEADEKEVGESLAPESSHCFPCQGGPEDEGDMSLNDEGMMEVKDHDDRERTLADVSLEKAKQNSPQVVGPLNVGPVHPGVPSGSCACLSCQQESPVSVGPQESKSHRAEGLERAMEVKAGEVSAGKLPLEDSPVGGNAWEEPGVAVEHLAPFGPEGDNEETTLSAEEEGGGFGQALENAQYSEGKGSLLVDAPHFEKPEDTEAGEVPSDPLTGSSRVPELFRGDELHVHSSDFEVEEEANKGTCLSDTTPTGIPQRGRGGLLLGPTVDLVSVAEKNSEVCEKLIFGPPLPGPCDAAVQEANVRSWEGRTVSDVSLEQPVSSHCGSNSDLDNVSVAIPETCSTERAVGGKLPPPAKNAVVGEELEDQDIKRVQLAPANPSSVFAELSCLSENDVKLGSNERAPDSAGGLEEDAGLVLAQADWIPSQLKVKTLAGPLGDGEPAKEHPGSDMPASFNSGKEEHAQKNGGKAPVEQHQEVKTLQDQGHTAHLEESLDSTGGHGENLEYHRTFLQKKEESKGSSFRKRHLDEDQEAFGLSGLEGGSCSEKRPCPLDPALVQAPPLALPVPTVTVLPPPPPPHEGHADQLGRTIGMFLDQYSSQITLHSEEAGQKSRDCVAQIVRNYFKNSSCKPAAENDNEGMPPLSAEVAEDTDFGPVGVLEAGENGNGDELASPEDQVKDTQCPASSPESQRLTSGTVSSQSHSPIQERGKDLESHTSESIWEACFSEEEDFQLQVCSELNHLPPGSPAQPPDAEHVPTSREKDLDFFFSDISNSSVEPDHCTLSIRSPGKDPSGVRKDGLPEGASEMADKAAEENEASESHCEAFDEGWGNEDPGTPSETLTSSQEGTQTETEDHVTVTPEKSDALGLPQADARSEGDDGGEAFSTVEFEQAAPSPVHSTTGEKEEDGGPCRRQTEDAAFPPRGHAEFPCPDREYEPAIDQPSATSPWKSSTPPCVQAGLGCSPVPLKREPSDEDHDGQNGGGQGLPSLFRTVPAAAAAAAAFELVSCPIEGGIKEEVSPPESSSVACPSPTQAKLTLLQDGSCLLNSSAVAAASGGSNDGASGRMQSKKGRPSLSLLPSFEASRPFDMATNGKEKDFGGHLGKDVSGKGSVAALPGQMDSRCASQGVPEEMAALPGSGAFGSQALSCNSSQPKEGASLLTQGQWAGVPPASQIFKEERDWCDAQDQLPSSSPGMPYPVACSPVIPVLPKPHHMPEPLADRQAESSGSPLESGSGNRLLLPYQLEEAEASGELETERVNSDKDEYASGPVSPGSEEGDSSTWSASPHAASTTQALSSSWPAANGSEGSIVKGWASSEQDIEFQLQECQSVLAEISGSLSGVEGIDDVHMEKWRDQIALLQKATKMPQTYIAVVGNTGAGKSCLLNALLDEEAVLPTSNMRACTAVVVEVSRAAGGSPYEADVEFLSREEWHKELRALLADMKDKSGNLKRRCPDRKTEAGAAYCRVKAVYGRIGALEVLEQMQEEVTQHLGTVKHLAAETAAVFRSNIEKFIDSRTDNLREMKGGEFWPIVKCVRIRVANSEVLKTGAVLVDLPGTRDSNAARDEAAKEYLKDCNAVWVVASINRAVDDKTAKEMLSANLRRQLLMDGQYGSLAFVCTKTDSFNITDIIRDLKLQDQIQCIEEELRELENQRMQAEAEKRSLYEHLQQEDQRRQGGSADSAWLQRQHEILEKEFQISNLQRQKEVKLRAISLICVQARNTFSKQRILKDFSADLEEMTRKGLDPECEEDSDEDMEEGDDASSDSPGLGEAEPRPGRLQVFTVSSTEYLKLCGKLLRDGQPQVFHDTKDTEIPALKKFAIDTALKHSMVATEKVIRDVARVLSQMVNYLTSQRAEDNSHQAQIQESVQRFLQDVAGHLQEPVEHCVRDVQYCFGVLIHDSLRKGAARAKERCEAIIKSWGSPLNGFPHATYHAVCCRHGVYTSPMYGCVDFNSDLAQPIHEAVFVTWNEVFNIKLLESISCFNKAFLVKLQSIFKDLERRLNQHSRIAEAVRTICWQQMEATRAKLINFTLDLMGYITHRQREISRLLAPEIKARMEPAYTACSQMSGRGYFQLMKAEMESYIHREKDAIFDSATKKLQERLGQLQQRIQEKFQSLVQELSRSLTMQFEPILKPVQKNGKIIPELMNICAKVDKLCRRSCVDYILPCPVLAADSSSGAEEELVRSQDPVNFAARHADVQVGAAFLPHFATVQPSVSSAENREISPALSVPPHPSVAILQPQLPPVPLHLSGKKRAGETIQPQLEKKFRGQAMATAAGCDFARHPSQHYSGVAEVKPEPCISPSLPTASRAPALEDCTQKASLTLGLSQTHVSMKVDGFAIPGSSGSIHVQAAEGIGGLCSNLNAEERGSEKAKEMDSGRETCSPDGSRRTP